MSLISWILLAVAIACLATGVFPQWNEGVDPATGDRVSELRLGLWFSPAHQSIRREPPQGGFTYEAGINWLSWSSLLVIVGAGSFEAFRWRRRTVGNTAPSPAASRLDGSPNAEQSAAPDLPRE